MTVTKVTADATLDDLSAQDYRDIYEELRRYDENTGKFIVSLDGLIALIGSAYSKGQWHKYHTGQMALTRTMRNELRVAMNRDALPLTVADAVAQHTSPDAAVYTVGAGVAGMVILVADGIKTTLHVNGSVAEAHGMPCNPGYSSTAPRKPVVRPVASKAQDERREALKTTWRDVIEAGLEAMEQK